MIVLFLFFFITVGYGMPLLKREEEKQCHHSPAAMSGVF